MIQRRKAVGMLLVLSISIGVAGCQPVSKEVESSVVTIKEQKQEWKQTSCATYELESAEFDKEKLWNDFIKENKEYEICDYSELKDDGMPKEYTMSGKQLLENPPKHFNHACTVGKADSLSFSEDVTLSEESLCLYEETEEEEDYFSYETAIGQFINNRVSYSDFLKQKWLEKELDFKTRKDIASETYTMLAKYGINVSNNMDIYAVTQQDMIDHYIKEWKDLKEVKESDLNKNYAVDGYYVQVYITANDICVIDDENANNSEDESYRELPKISLYYTKEGVQFLEVTNYQQPGKKKKEEKIITYEEAKNNLLKQYNGVETTDTYQYEAGRLEYLPVDEDGKVYIMPVWAFQGKRKRTLNGKETITDVFFMVDACTGKILR